MRLLLPPERGETPGSMQKPNPPAAPRIDSRGCDPRCSLGRNKDRLAHKLKVANRAGFVAEGSPARCAASAKRAVRDGYSFQFKGAALGAPLVTFPATGKSPGVEGRSALLVGAGTTVPQRPPGWRGGAPSWWMQGLPSRKGPRGGGAERPYMGKERRGWGAAPPRIGKGPSGPEAIISLPEGKNNRLRSAVGC